MHHVFSRLILMVLFALPGRASHLTSADFKCQQQTSSCYSEILQQLQSEGQAVPLQEQTDYLSVRLHNHGSIMRLQSQRTPIVFLMIHGLWATEKENNMLANMLAKYGHFNVLQFTLPGHSTYSEMKDRITYPDWIASVRDAVQTAQLFGDKIVIGGHSTGAVLSAEMVLQNQDDFAGLFLIEPAFRVNPILTIGSCIGKLIIKNLQKLAPLIGHHVDRPLPMSFGCEVAKMSRHFRQNLENMGAEILVPTLIMQNLRDYVVSKKAIQNFANVAHGDTVHLKFNQDKDLKHGDILDPPQEGLLANLFCQYLQKQQYTPVDLQLYCSALPQP